MPRPTSLALLLLSACAPPPEGWSVRECSDGIDNDDNALVDCDDPGCVGVVGCTGDVDTDGGTDAEQDSDTDTDEEHDTELDSEVDTDADTEPLDPIPNALAESPPAYDPECDQRNGVSVAGALVWNLGRLTFVGSEIRGYAVWGLRANPAWQAGPGYDCQLTWQVSGVQGDPGPCTACDYSLPLDLTLLPAESTCDPALEESLAGPRTVTYNVQLDGTQAELFFPATGNRFATGTATSTSMNYRSPAQCIFFSSR